MIKGKKILLLAPHPDDPEYACGGSIARWSKENELFYMAFSPCNISLPDGFPENILYEELLASAKVLGIAKGNITTFDFPVRRFPEHRQDILEEMVMLRKSIHPDIVLMPNSNDIHQDHKVIYEEGVRAFKHCSLLGYELPWNNLQFTSNFHVTLSKDDLAIKWEAIASYKSQEIRAYKSEDFFEGLARVRGLQVGSEFAEAFELIRWIL
ncbi:MAG: PIG-L family deacetylase [Bacteroidales bacterium]|nr:PIG-L family deacetylase [Bacteroidales bacterium]